MRKLHPSYEAFALEQQPKYGQTFVDWYKDNYKVGEVDLLQLLTERVQSTFGDRHAYGSYNLNADGTIKEFIFPSYFSDIFSKKLQLCKNIIMLKQGSNYSPYDMNYNLDIVADVMDMYEEIIFEICTTKNVGVCGLPNGNYHNGSVFSTEHYTFDGIENFKKELSTGEVIIYYFKINKDLTIEARMAKQERLTRKVLVEKMDY